MDIWYSMAKSLVRMYLSLFTEGIVISGQERIFAGPKIIIANHTYVTDAFVLPIIFTEKLHFLIQESTFHLPLIGRLLALADQIPVRLGQGREALRAARERLRWGHVVVIFPEGRLNHGEGLRRAGSGAVWLALETGAPLLPLGIYVPPDFVWRIKARLQRRITLGAWQMRGELFVRIGEPWLLPARDAAECGYRALRDLTNNLMARVASLVQQAQELARRSAENILHQ